MTQNSINYIDKPFEVQKTSDVVYANAAIHFSDQPIKRNLLLDIYQPIGLPLGMQSPALIMAFGGAFHRGSKDDDAFEVDGSRNTAIAEYCLEFAKRGYVCFSIDYRLIQEDPDPGNTVSISNPDFVPRSRVDEVRKIMNLPPADNLMLWRGIEGAIDDGVAAIQWVKNNSERLNIDPQKIAIGGWSAGGRIALHAAFAEREEVAAVFSISGYMHPEDMKTYMHGGLGVPPVFVSWGSKDLDYVLSQGPVFQEHFNKVGIHHVACAIQDASHFYPRNIPVSDSTGLNGTFEDSLAHFLKRALNIGVDSIS
jgi:predicted esterase